MVAYFKFQNNLFMAAGAALGAVLTVVLQKDWLMQQTYMKLFYVVIDMFIGIIIGRILSSFYANKRIHDIDALLYQRSDPEAFMKAFAPLVKRVPVETIEYINGRYKLAYACEAMGRFEEGLALIQDLRPDQLKLHSLAASSLIANQILRFSLLMENRELAVKQLQKLAELQDTAQGRVPALVKSIEECIHLGRIWLGYLNGERTDDDYIREEIRLAKNAIHKGEMLLLLAQMKRETNPEEAGDLLEEVLQTVPDLYAGQQAKKLLAEWK